MEPPNPAGFFGDTLTHSRIGMELLSKLPLHILMIQGQENDAVRRIVGNDHFWELWVKENVSPRHIDESMASFRRPEVIYNATLSGKGVIPSRL